MVNYKNTYNKFKNQKCKCKSGHIHKSRGESGYCDQLLLEKKAGLIKDYEVEKLFRMKVNDIYITGHKPDFLIENLDGSFEVREFKGFETDEWRFKKRLFEAIYPEIPYKVIKK